LLRRLAVLVTDAVAAAAQGGALVWVLFTARLVARKDDANGPEFPMLSRQTRNCDVLIVDDNEDMREVLREVLSDRMLATECAPSGDAAIGMLTAGLRPSVMLVDGHMPGRGACSCWPRLAPITH
jgi:PleD family two-component response regulator